MEELPAGVRRFLDAHIFSASQLEVLLLLRQIGEPLPLAELARRTALPAGSLRPWLDAFTARGLLAVDGDAYRYAPATPETARDVDEVADTWRRRSTTMTRYIYAASTDPLLRFADAFRLRRPSDGTGRDGGS